MKSRAVCCCLLGLLVYPTNSNPETFQQYRGKNGEMAFTNLLPAAPASTELQKAREQAEIEYWRAREAQARSLRHTPDTEVHRNRRSALQVETPLLSPGPVTKGQRRKVTKNKTEGFDNPEDQISDNRKKKKSRSRKAAVQYLKNDSALDVVVKQSKKRKVKMARK